MGFAHIEVARGRVTRPLQEVAVSIRSMGRGATPTVQVFISPNALRATGLKIGDSMSILVGDGEDEGKIRLVREKDGRGDVAIRTNTNVAVGYLASRLIPRNGVEKFRRVEVGYSIVEDGCIELELPWFAAKQEDAFVAPNSVDDAWGN